MTSGTDVVTTAEPEVTGRRGRPRLSEGARAERRLGWLLCAPAVIVMIAVAAFPILYAVWLSLQRYDLRFPQLAHFVGFSNYAAVLSSPYWWHALVVTLIITVVSLAVTVAAAYGWQYAWTPHIGYLVGPTSAPLTSQGSAIAIIILAEIWKTTPFMALLLMAGLSLVPEDLLKAARVDGATAWQRFSRVTLPLMKPAILVALLFRALDAFRIFDNIYILTNGGNGTYSVSILGYDNLFRALNLGIGSAISILIFICVAIIAFIFIRIFGAAAPGA
jgi:multiple sugar transport system permease protein